MRTCSRSLPLPKRAPRRRASHENLWPVAGSGQRLSLSGVPAASSSVLAADWFLDSSFLAGETIALGHGGAAPFASCFTEPKFSATHFVSLHRASCALPFFHRRSLIHWPHACPLQCCCSVRTCANKRKSGDERDGFLDAFHSHRECVYPTSLVACRSSRWRWSVGLSEKRREKHAAHRSCGARAHSRDVTRAICSALASGMLDFALWTFFYHRLKKKKVDKNL